MALQELPSPTAAPLKAGGIEDNQQVVTTPDWYKLFSLIQRDQKLIRIPGKSISLQLTEPILAIHFDNKGSCLIQTSGHLYRYTAQDVTGDSVSVGEIV